MAKCVRCGKRGLFLKIDENGNCQQCALEIKRQREEEERKRLEEETRKREEEIAERKKKEFEKEKEFAIIKFNQVKYQWESKKKPISEKKHDELCRDDRIYDTGYLGWYIENDVKLKKKSYSYIGRMSMDKIGEKLAEDLSSNTGFGKELEAYNREREEENAENLEKHEKIIMLHEKAHDLERDGDLEGALELYIKNLESHPDGTVYFDRPCIVLEKLGRYEEAIELCNQALERIDKKKMNCNPGSYYKRRDRLWKKIEKRDKK